MGWRLFGLEPNIAEHPVIEELNAQVMIEPIAPAWARVLPQQGRFLRKRRVIWAELFDCNVTPEQAQELELCGDRMVEAIHLSDMHLSSTICSSIFLSDRLVDVRLENCTFEAGDGSELKLSSELTNLELKNMRLGDRLESVLAQARMLQDLELIGQEFSDDDVDAILQCRELESVDVSRTEITSAGVERLLKLPKIWRVDTEDGIVSPRSEQ